MARASRLSVHMTIWIRTLQTIAATIERGRMCRRFASTQQTWTVPHRRLAA